MRFWPFRTETKSLTSPTAEEFAIFGAAPATAYSASVSEAMMVPAVQRALTLIPGSIAAFDIMVERREGDAWKRDHAHPVGLLLADAPNEWTSWHETIRDLIATALSYDKGGLALVNKVEGRIVELIRYEPAHYQVDYSTDGRQEPTYRINNIPTPAGDVVHLRSALAKSPLTLALDAIGVAKKMEAHAGGLFARGARPSGIIRTKKNVGDEGVRKMLAGWRAAHEGAANAGRTAILWDDAEWSATVLNSVDAQFLETWKFVLLEIARAFAIPPQMLFDFDRATWSNAEQAGKEWLASLELWMKPLEAALRRALFSEAERPDMRVRFDRDDFTNVDLTARATAISSLVASRVLNPNEGRDWLGMPPREGGQEFANPNTGSSQPGAAAPQETRDAA